MRGIFCYNSLRPVTMARTRTPTKRPAPRNFRCEFRVNVATGLNGDRMTVICWFRRVLRLDDHPALLRAVQSGQAVVPLVILDPAEARSRPASAFRQGLTLERLDRDLRDRGSRLIVRAGAPADVLVGLAHEIGARAVHSTEGFPFAADAPVRDALARADLDLHLAPNGDLVPRGAVLTRQGGIYRVFSPFWKALRGTDIAPPENAPARIPAPDRWPTGMDPDWPDARAAMGRGAEVVARHARVGEAAARDHLQAFLEDAVSGYQTRRELPGADGGTSNLSEALAVGEISARRVWDIARAARDRHASGTDHFLSELAWREFARELFSDFPAMADTCWRAEWQRFPWRRDNADAQAWRRAETGVEMVDAGMRQIYATGRMHNRVRMIAASYLTKHLLTDWRVGRAWFEHALTDWDPASNAMNWQWVAGCGPDAAPYFRVFNPDTQGEKFDPERRYRDHWLRPDGDGARDFAAAAPRSWQVDPARRPRPAAPLAEGRQRALDAYAQLKS